MTLEELIQAQGVQQHLKPLTHNLLLNIRGANGSGKSTIPICMLEDDPDAFEVTAGLNGKPHVLATVSPKYHTAALGKYRTACGGLDTFKDINCIKVAAAYMWMMDYNLIMEGILASTVYGSYITLFNTLHKILPRRMLVLNLEPPLETCLQRVYERNGGKPVKEEQIRAKYNRVKQLGLKFEEYGFNVIHADNSVISRADTLTWAAELTGCADFTTP